MNQSLSVTPEIRHMLESLDFTQKPTILVVDDTPDNLS